MHTPHVPEYLANDDISSLPTIEDCFSAPFPRGTRPFESPQWHLWRMCYQMPPNPDDAHQQRIKLATTRTVNPLTPGQYKALVPRTAEERAREMSVYQSWVNREKLYSSHRLILQAKMREGAGAYARRKGIPDYLDIVEYEFLVHFLNRTQRGCKIKLLDKDNYKHPTFQNKTRVGAVYGNWHLTALASEKEETSHKTLYVVRCIHCGFTHERFSYSRLGHPCPKCMKQAKPKDKEIQVDFTIWNTPQGVCVQKNRPDGAFAVAKQTAYGVPAPWTDVTGLESAVEDEPATNSEETCQPQQSAQQEEPPKEDPFIKDLQIPGF